MVARCLVVLVVAGLSSLGSTAFADIGPDDYGYHARVVDYQFEDITGLPGAVRTLAGTDEGCSYVTLPFTFTIYGQTYGPGNRRLDYSTNGLITFNYQNSSSANGDLTKGNSGVGVPTIAALWDDWYLNSPGTDAVYYSTLGIPGSQRFVLQWNRAVPWDARNDAVPNPVTFQVVLYEGSNDIRINYLDVNTKAGYANGASATVGICDAYGYNDGRVLQWSYNQSLITDQSSILFTTVPVPGTALLVSLGLGVVGWARRRFA